jgi:hypothetical protein
VRYTFSGDSNLDGTVDSADFNALALHFNQDTQQWVGGDFNFDGVVNALDFNAIATNFGALMPTLLQGTLVPEPSLAAILVLLPLSIRRSKRSFVAIVRR